MLQFLYNTVFGRIILKFLVCKPVSTFVGLLLSTKFSKFFIKPYVKKNKINFNGIYIPQNGFQSFNDFFSRTKIKTDFSKGDKILYSPCDAFLTIQKIDGNTFFSVKNSSYTINDLLQDEQTAKQFKDGTALIFRLTPNHYHRYCFAADGTVVTTQKLPGILHCVRPIALRQFPVFAQNAREYCVINTNNFGTILQMEVGALFVGKICNAKYLNNECVKGGTEKGFFQFGGSTIILLLQKGKAKINDEILNRTKNEHGEVSVKYGENLLTVD